MVFFDIFQRWVKYLLKHDIKYKLISFTTIKNKIHYKCIFNEYYVKGFLAHFH